MANQERPISERRPSGQGNSLGGLAGKSRELVVSAQFTQLANFLVLEHFGGLKSYFGWISIGLASVFPMKKGISPYLGKAPPLAGTPSNQHKKFEKIIFLLQSTDCF